MNSSEIVELKLEPALRECRLHERRLAYAQAQLANQLPLSAAGWESLDDETVADIDQLLFRYNKLQDAMGQRLFPAILMLGGDWREDQTFIDRLDLLEKLGAIPSAQQWSELRAIRNKMTHEYPDAPEVNAANLNRVVESIGPLREALDQSDTFAKRLVERVVSR